MAVFAEACRQRDSRFSDTISSAQSAVAQGNLLYMFAHANTQSGADGRVSGTVEYDVFGEPVTGTGVFAGSAGGSGGISALVFAYAGKPYDPVTGLSDYGFRDYAPTLARFTTVDPIRDGSNWYAYCNSDPVNYVDMWGLENIKPIRLIMQDYQWGEQILGDPNGNASSNLDKIKESGCFLTGYSEAAITLTGIDYTPDYFNQYVYLFDSKQNFRSSTASNITGLKNINWNKSHDGDLASVINKLDDSSTEYVLMAQVPYTTAGKLHWVTIYGNVDSDGYVNAVGTSKNDYNKYSQRGKIDTWKFLDDGIKVKASDIKDLRVFSNGCNNN